MLFDELKTHAGHSRKAILWTVSRTPEHHEYFIETNHISLIKID